MESQHEVEKKAIPLGVVPVKTVLRRPRAILKEDHLMSSKGIAALPDIFATTRFKGKGHELDDLRLLLSKSKHWAHRLFPTMIFEDFVERSEQLGTKKRLKNFLTKVRHNMPLNLDPEELVVPSGGESDHEVDMANLEAGPTTASKDSELQFDRLFQDHIDEMTKAKDDDSSSQQSNGTSSQATVPRPTHQQPPVEDFAMDDDDFDDDFLSSFKP